MNRWLILVLVGAQLLAMTGCASLYRPKYPEESQRKQTQPAAQAPDSAAAVPPVAEPVPQVAAPRQPERGIRVAEVHR